MADAYHHAVSSSRQWGGTPEDYLDIHSWFDSTKRHFNDPRHRALRHHSEGIGLCIDIFGPTVSLSTCARCGEPERHVVHQDGEHEFVSKEVPTRWVAERHVQEDFGRVPCVADFLRCMALEPWMARGARPLSKEL
jgi:hypothetical protein